MASGPGAGSRMAVSLSYGPFKMALGTRNPCSAGWSYSFTLFEGSTTSQGPSSGEVRDDIGRIVAKYFCSRFMVWNGMCSFLAGELRLTWSSPNDMVGGAYDDFIIKAYNSPF